MRVVVSKAAHDQVPSMSIFENRHEIPPSPLEAAPT